jgi:hypothetical protein
VRGKAKGEIVLTQGEPVHRSDEATGFEIEHPGLAREAIGRLAYFYWEERGCPNDSPDEDWFRAEAEVRRRIDAAASHNEGGA